MFVAALNRTEAELNEANLPGPRRFEVSFKGAHNFTRVFSSNQGDNIAMPPEGPSGGPVIILHKFTTIDLQGNQTAGGLITLGLRPTSYQIAGLVLGDSNAMNLVGEEHFKILRPRDDPQGLYSWISEVDGFVDLTKSGIEPTISMRGFRQAQKEVLICADLFLRKTSEASKLALKTLESLQERCLVSYNYSEVLYFL